MVFDSVLFSRGVVFVSVVHCFVLIALLCPDSSFVVRKQLFSIGDVLWHVVPEHGHRCEPYVRRIPPNRSKEIESSSVRSAIAFAVCIFWILKLYMNAHGCFFGLQLCSIRLPALTSWRKNRFGYDSTLPTAPVPLVQSRLHWTMAATQRTTLVEIATSRVHSIS